MRALVPLYLEEEIMWNRNREDVPAPRQGQPSAAEPLREHAPVAPATAPLPAAAAVARSAAPVPNGTTAVLGRSVTVRGEIFSQEDLLIDGDVEGSVEVQDHRLTLGPNGRLKAGAVKAREIVVFGTLNGNVEARDKVFIRKDASLVGDITTAGIVIEDGAYFKGGIDITRRSE